MGHVVSTKADFRRLTTNSDDDDSLFLGEFEYPSKSENDAFDQANSSNKENDQLSGEECPICTEDIYLRDLAKLDPCNHEFHQQCINQWLEEHNTCPNCRADVVQIVYGYKMCMRRKVNRRSIDDLLLDDDDDDLDDESIEEVHQFISSPNDDLVSDSQSITSTTIILGSDTDRDVTESEWLNAEHLVDPETGKPELEVDITPDKSVRLTFDFTWPEITVNCDRWCRLTLHGDIVAEISPTSCALLRGQFVLQLKDYRIDVDGEVISFFDKQEIADLYDEQADTTDWSQLKRDRHDRFTSFLQYLRDPIAFSFL